jgi:cysteine desulfurase
MTKIYLDHTATTPLDPTVLEAMEPYFLSTFGNASSIHGFGQEARSALERARGDIAAGIGADPSEITFVSGGTESDNLAIVGVIRAAREGRKAVVTSRTEHHAVLDVCEHLAGNGADVTVLGVDERGSVRMADFQDAVTERTALVSIMHANNEVGTIALIAELASIAHSQGALFHTDAVQSVGKIPVDVNTLGVDLLTLTAHKLNGPKGIGALYVRRGTPLQPMFHGGGQERGLRPGTLNVPLAVGFARAVVLAIERRKEEAARLRTLRDALERRLRETFPALVVNGHPTDRLPHLLSVSFDSARMPMEGEMLVMAMDMRGIAVSSGSACTSGSVQPSHVLRAMGRDEGTAKAALRFSFGRGNTMEDVEVAVAALKDAVSRMGRRE